MNPEDLLPTRLSWRWIAVLILFLSALAGFASGVAVTHRPEIVDAGLAAQAYYSLGLFVIGGLDLGTPTGGPQFGRVLLWFAYFGAPLLTASALIEAVVRLISPSRWQLRRLRGHVVINGSGRLARAYLRALRQEDPDVRVVVVAMRIEDLAERELVDSFDATVLKADIRQPYVLEQLRVKRARRIVLLGDNDFRSFETASRIASFYPRATSKIILHCNNLRFLRSLEATELVRQFVSFNTYHLTAEALVREHLTDHFHKTADRDQVVLAGFGRFGQSVLEELDANSAKEIACVAVLDTDAQRRILVVDEQKRLAGTYRREVVEGDIGHPQTWQQLEKAVDLSIGEPAIVLGTGNSEQNLRTALWLRDNYPNAKLYMRTNGRSSLAQAMGEEFDIIDIGITQLLEDHLPKDMLN